ncbi:MAG: hypothetical protein JW768_08700 [Chitinispirillaceae bacterium]|nr:hypothetical protein [Chitinispirillaceae bacterium]
MMSNDDFNRGNQIQQGRKPYQPNRYNAGANYNYTYGYNPNQNFNGQQHPRRRADRYKRESLNFNDRLSKQNDMIIRLLKEIRDRLPPSPVDPSHGDDGNASVQQQELAGAAPVAEAADREQETPEEAAVVPPVGEEQQFEAPAEEKADAPIQ